MRVTTNGSLIKRTADYDTGYIKIMKELKMLLRPYEPGLTVVVRQKDTLCLYTGSPVEMESVLFAAIQIMKGGVVLTHYQPSGEVLSHYKLPKKLQEFKTGNYRFTFTKLSREVKNDLKLLFSFLFAVCKLEKLL